MENPVSEQGQEENREKDCHQDIQSHFLYVFGVHGDMPQEELFCVNNRIAETSNGR